MKISIVIRTKDEENWLKACLHSISMQSYQNYEIVLVDNQSKDKTVEIAEFHGIRKIIRIGKYSPGDALNKGIGLSNGDIFVFLSAHCVPTNHLWLENLISPLESENVVASYGRQVPTMASNPDNARDLLMVFGNQDKLQNKEYKFHNANSAIKASYFKDNPFDESLTNIEDWYWAKNAISNGFQIAYVSDASVFHHHGLNQHLNIKSFRAEPVAKLLRKLYEVENIPAFFEEYSFWNGLIIASVDCESNLQQISRLKKQLTDIDIFPTSHVEIKDCHLISPEISFEEYLLEALNKAEIKNNTIYDYFIFVDFHYHKLAIEGIATSVEKLFHDWLDIAAPARDISGWVFSKSERILEQSRINGEKIEILFGQGAAFRTSVIRRRNLENSNIDVSCILDREFAFKKNWHAS